MPKWTAGDLVHTVFVLQLVLLEGVAADCGYDIECVQALCWLDLAHMALCQGTYMLVALHDIRMYMTFST